MTDKDKQIILAEIEKRMENAGQYSIGAYNGMKEIRDYINSLPEEPVSKVWHDATEEPVEEEYPIIVIDSANCVYLIDKDDSEPFDSKDKWLSVHDILPKKD